jgi:hypothetical protein
MNRLTETIVLRGSVAASASAAAPIWRLQDHAAGVVGQAFGHAVAHGRHERMRGAEVDADRDAALVRVGRAAGF